MDASLKQEAWSALDEVLRGRGIASERWRGGLLLADAGGEVSLDCAVQDRRERSGVVSVELRMDLMPRLPGETRSIRDMLVGHGSTDAEAIRDGLEVWADGVLEPVQRALLRKDARPDALWTAPGDTRHAWRVYLGPMQVAGAAREVHASWPSEHPLGLLAGRLQERVHGPSLHWVKVFLARMDGSLLGAECRADNDPWLEGEALLTGFSWPTTAEYFAFKRFLLFKPMVD